MSWFSDPNRSMRRALQCFLLLVSLVATGSVAARANPEGESAGADQSANGAKGIYWVKSDGTVNVTVNWCDSFGKPKQTDPCPAAPKDASATPPKIDANDIVVVHVEGFNFLRFGLGFSVEEETVEEYAYLANIWSQILGFPSSATTSVSGRTAAFETAATEWLRLVRSARAELSQHVGKYTDSWLTEKQADDIYKLIDTFATVRIKEIRQAADDALAHASTLEEMAKFEQVEVRSNEVLKALSGFVEAARLVELGKSRAVGKKKEGTIVTLSMTAEPDANTTGRPQTKSISYFVQSELPLEFHIGYAHSELEDVDFRAVRSLEGRDLFALIQTDSGTDELTAFVSYELRSWGEKAEGGLYASLGTDFGDPGDRLYIGLSARFAKRWFLTAGAVTSEVVEGEGVVMEMPVPGSDLPGRRLFEFVREERDWSFFFGVSFNVF